MSSYRIASFLIVSAVIAIATSCKNDDSDTIVGNWEGKYDSDVLTLAISADGTGEAGGPGMQSTPIVWARVGEEFQITSTKFRGLVSGVLEEDGSLTLRQPDHPDLEPLKMRRRPRR